MRAVVKIWIWMILLSERRKNYIWSLMFGRSLAVRFVYMLCLFCTCFVSLEYGGLEGQKHISLNTAATARVAYDWQKVITRLPVK